MAINIVSGVMAINIQYFLFVVVSNHIKHHSQNFYRNEMSYSAEMIKIRLHIDSELLLALFSFVAGSIVRVCCWFLNVSRDGHGM